MVSKKKGFTLIEAFAATCVLAISLLSAGFAIYTQLYFINQLREKSIATLAAQEEVEAIRGMPFDNVLNLGSSFTASGFTYLKSPVGTVTVDDIYSTGNMRRVSITVSWASVTGKALQRTLVTLMSRNGINKQ